MMDAVVARDLVRKIVRNFISLSRLVLDSLILTTPVLSKNSPQLNLVVANRIKITLINGDCNSSRRGF